MADLATFRQRFTEFAQAKDNYVESFLVAAALEVDTVIWGTKADEGVMYMAAHKMAMSPFGNTAKLTIKVEGILTTTYMLEYKRLCRQVGMGLNKVLSGGCYPCR